MNLLIEKYRPNKLVEVIQQSNVTKYLKISNNIPNLLLYGPSGTENIYNYHIGKTNFFKRI